jgi:hypothetical protein
MKRFLSLLFLACAIQLPLFAQGVIQFDITFPGSQPPPAIGVPGGSAELSGSSFTPWVFLGTSAADYGRILEMAGDSSLTLVFQFTSVLVDSHPPTPGIPGSGGTFYSYLKTWDLSPSKLRAFWQDIGIWRSPLGRRRILLRSHQSQSRHPQHCLYRASRVLRCVTAENYRVDDDAVRALPTSLRFYGYG